MLSGYTIIIVVISIIVCQCFVRSSSCKNHFFMKYYNLNVENLQVIFNARVVHVNQCPGAVMVHRIAMTGQMKKTVRPQLVILKKSSGKLF